jgi:hypothetical protein
VDAIPTDDELAAPGAPSPLLAPRTLDEMHTPQAIDANWTGARCLGWFGMRRNELVVIGHGGSIHGFITQIFFHKASGTGVIVLTNEGRHGGAAPAALDLMDIVLQTEKEQPKAPAEKPPAATPAELRRFVGLYRLWGGSLTHVEYRDGALRLAAAPPDKLALHAPSKLAPTHDPLVYRAMQGRGAGELVKFEAADAAARAVVGAEGSREADEAPITGFTLSGLQYTKLV